MYAAFLVPWWLIVLLLVPLAIWCVALGVRRPRQRWAWTRRLLIVVLLAVVAIRPVTPAEGEQTQRMNADVFFVVDRTGSMNAEDYDGTSPRLDGVKDDMRQVMAMTKGARYSIIGFDSTAAQQLPLTTDAGAATSWIDTVTTEPTAYSQGSNIDRPLRTLTTAITETAKDDPDSSILVYFMSDGENTDGKDTQSFSGLAQYIDGGGVLGYGTSSGGAMKSTGAGSDGSYITDSSGAKGLSKIDEAQLKAVAEQMGVPYLHRTAPDEDLSETMDGITLRAVPTTSSSDLSTFTDWYWIAAIPLAILFVWELGATTYRLPRPVERPAAGRASQEKR